MILQSIAMTNMKLQWIYYYNDLIPIILQSIVIKKKNWNNYLLQKDNVAIIWSKLFLTILYNQL